MVRILWEHGILQKTRDFRHKVRELLGGFRNIGLDVSVQTPTVSHWCRVRDNLLFEKKMSRMSK